MGMRYLLDTNICNYIAKHNPPEVRERFARHTANELAMSVITLGGLRFGAEKSQMRERALGSIQSLAQLITLAPPPEAAGEHYGQIRVELQKAARSLATTTSGSPRMPAPRAGFSSPTMNASSPGWTGCKWRTGSSKTAILKANLAGVDVTPISHHALSSIKRRSGNRSIAAVRFKQACNFSK